MNTNTSNNNDNLFSLLGVSSSALLKNFGGGARSLEIQRGLNSEGEEVYRWSATGEFSSKKAEEDVVELISSLSKRKTRDSGDASEVSGSSSLPAPKKKKRAPIPPPKEPLSSPARPMPPSGLPSPSATSYDVKREVDEEGCTPAPYPTKSYLDLEREESLRAKGVAGFYQPPPPYASVKKEEPGVKREKVERREEGGNKRRVVYEIVEREIIELD